MLSKQTVVMPSLVLLAILATGGCQQEGPAERAGKAVDEAAEDVREGLEDLGDRARECLDTEGDDC